MTSLIRRRFLQTSTLAAASTALSRYTPAQTASSSSEATIDILPSETLGTIAPEIYSHFIEQLGGVIYDGVWVGEKSKIPNLNGVRLDFINTMKAVQAPVLRWPGGCFADSYDWREGIGPANQRPNRAAFWNQQENNRYGLHEFMATCRAIGCQPYLAGDLRSLPARDFYQFIEYCNTPAGNNPSNSANPAAPDTLASERAANGSPEPFNVQYWGVGNESWGCGGSQTPEEYAGEFRRYTAWVPNTSQPTGHPRPLKFVAVGPNGDDIDWTRRLFKALGGSHPWGLSVHYYTSGSPSQFAAGDALNFDNNAYYDLLTRGAAMEQVITDHFAAIGELVPHNPVKLVIDEWGAWYGRGTELGPGYLLSQQSTMRDALLSGITLDTFQRHPDKVAMANVAQSINCIHSLMLAQEDRFCVTPTFHVFRMYLPHSGATAVRADFSAETIADPMAGAPIPVGGETYLGSVKAVKTLAGLSGSASMQGKTLTLSVVNPHLDRPLTTQITVRSASTISAAKGTVLASHNVHDHNDFTNRNAVHPIAATTGQPSGTRLMHTFPPASITTLQLTLS